MWYFGGTHGEPKRALETERVLSAFQTESCMGVPVTRAGMTGTPDLIER